MKECTQKCRECLDDPDTTCAIQYPEVWNKIYAPSLEKCQAQMEVKKQSCEVLEKIYAASLRATLERKKL